MNSDSSHQAAVAAVQSFNRRSHHGQVEDHQHHVNVNAACHTGNTIASKKFSSTGPMGMPGGTHDMNKFYMSSLLNLNQTQTTSKENASASNHQGKYFCLFCLDHLLIWIYVKQSTDEGTIAVLKQNNRDTVRLHQELWYANDSGRLQQLLYQMQSMT